MGREAPACRAVSDHGLWIFAQGGRHIRAASGGRGRPRAGRDRGGARPERGRDGAIECPGVRRPVSLHRGTRTPRRRRVEQEQSLPGRYLPPGRGRGRKQRQGSAPDPQGRFRAAHLRGGARRLDGGLAGLRARAGGGGIARHRHPAPPSHAVGPDPRGREKRPARRLSRLAAGGARDSQCRQGEFHRDDDRSQRPPVDQGKGAHQGGGFRSGWRRGGAGRRCGSAARGRGRQQGKGCGARRAAAGRGAGRHGRAGARDSRHDHLRIPLGKVDRALHQAHRRNDRGAQGQERAGAVGGASPGPQHQGGRRSELPQRPLPQPRREGGRHLYRHAACARATVLISPRPAPASWRTMSSARSSAA